MCAIEKICRYFSCCFFMGSGLMGVNVMDLFYDYLKGGLVAVAFYN